MNLHENIAAFKMMYGKGPKPKSGALSLKGEVDSVGALPMEGNQDGDVYIVGQPSADDKAEYYWFGGTWNYLGETPIDLSAYATKKYVDENEVGKKYYVDGTAKGETFNNASVASGNYSHAEGTVTRAVGNYAHAEGAYTAALSECQHAQGRYNVEDSAGKYAFIVGNGTSNAARSNAFAIDWQGNIYANNSSTGVNVNDLMPKSSIVKLNSMEEFDALTDKTAEFYFIKEG